MEVVAAGPATTGGTMPPFRDHDVREWSRIDTITGALERARLETDSWTASTTDASHKYGKVVDSRARTGADGSLQQQASRQLEVFQSRAAGARFHVVKTRTVSSSRWSGKGDAPTKGLGVGGFEDLQLTLNPLDLTSQKSKASVGRSVSRRPPSRQPRSTESSTSFQTELNSPLRNPHFTAATNLHRVSRLCHQIHESAVRHAFGRKSPVSPRESGDGSVSGVEITEIESSTTSSSDVNSHSNLTRTKSTSSDDLHQIPEKESGAKSIEDLQDLEQLQNWRRSSKIRRSLQYPKISSPTKKKPSDLPETSVSVRKIREELEKGRRLNTALRNNSVDLEALDQIIQSISSASSLERSSTDDNLDDHENEQLISKPKQKRDSFVTVKSLQEVKGRLRRTSSPGSDIYNTQSKPKDQDSDDGIVTEDLISDGTSIQARVKSYVYGMENMLQNKKPVIGTGSLESRSKLVNGTASHKNEDWYNRRKSYGFEKVHGHEEPSSMPLKNKNRVESSTDSGICRSSEIVVVPTATKTNNHDTHGRYKSDSESDVENKFNSYNKSINGINYGNVKKMTSIFQEDRSPYYNRPSHDELTNGWNKRAALKENDWKTSEIKSTTITIPIVKNNNVVDLSWNDEPEKEAKRHSIAVDDATYTSNGTENRLRRTSLVANDQYLKLENLDDDASNPNRKTKKVEFCKTEVHFAAESGKVNIVETDEKPPPTQNFRRRRRNSGPITNFSEDFNKNGLPMLHFGDSSYEKTMFGVTNNDETETKVLGNEPINIYENLHSRIPSTFGVVTVNTNKNKQLDYLEEDRKDYIDNENIKGILKNKPIKPKPYHLGNNIPFTDSNSDEDSRRWGIRLRHIPKEESRDPPIWKSTVTVCNSYYDQEESKQSEQLTINDQPELKKLLQILTPTKKPDYLSDNENRYSDSFANVRDNRRSSWSVADKVKLVDEVQESKGYSTKVTFGNGEAIVVENDQATWPRVENLSKDSKQILNKGLVVRIGKQDSASKHTVCSKMTTTRENNNTTTTTKITIDLSPSPPTSDKPTVESSSFNFTKYKRSQAQHSFKSTPLVLNTIKGQKESANKVPQQLEALKKLYLDVPSDSDADKEVQQLMSRIIERDENVMDRDNSSILSGSWSKMKAFKNFGEAERSSFRRVKSRYDQGGAKVEKDNTERLKPHEPIDSHHRVSSYNKYNIHPTKSKFSPVVLRKTIPITASDLKERSKTEKLSSPLLVGRNLENATKFDSGRISPTKEYRNVTDSKLQTKYINENVVLRQPRKSEMTYFGVNVSPKPSKKIATAVIKKESKLFDKPDLLQHHKRSPSSSPTKMKPRKPSPENNTRGSSSPIYENLTAEIKEPKRKYSSSKDFDSNILDELTKAADQIMQAVNGYTDEDCQNRLTSDEEDIRKPLDTISETKSWRTSAQEAKNNARMRPTLASAAKVRVKRTSSTSSVESLSKDRRKPNNTGNLTERKSAPSLIKSDSDKPKKKISSDSGSTKASTKARRLQRASSREALLQSHGSSSEDLPTHVEAPVRKPRLVKKTKAAQLTMTNGMELKKPVKKKEVENSKVEERILGSLPEIRHKTAISTIRSTGEKSVRDKSKQRNDENKTRSQTKRESSSRGTLSSTSTRPTSSANRGHHHQSQRLATTQKDSAVTQHRISTANIKKCHRSEGLTRH